MNAISISHWGLIKFPDDDRAANILYNSDGTIEQLDDDAPSMIGRNAAKLLDRWISDRQYDPDDPIVCPRCSSPAIMTRTYLDGDGIKSRAVGCLECGFPFRRARQ